LTDAIVKIYENRHDLLAAGSEGKAP